MQITGSESGSITTDIRAIISRWRFQLKFRSGCLRDGSREQVARDTFFGPGFAGRFGCGRAVLRLVAASFVGWLSSTIHLFGPHDVPVGDQARLLTDRGSGYLVWTFEDYLRMLSIQHIPCSPHHPQTNGKLERFHQTLQARVNLLVYTCSSSEQTFPHSP